MIRTDFFHKKYIVLVIIAVLCSMLILLAEGRGLFDLANLKAYDTLFYLKAKLSASAPESQVVIVEVDDRTFEDKAFRIPFILWHRHFATVIKGLADSRTRVIGLDYLLSQELFDDIVPDYSRTWLRALGYAKHRGTPVITGYVETKGRRFLPHAHYRQLIGSENMGLFNLTTDADDFVRRQRLTFPSEHEKTPVPGFAYLLARTFDSETTLPSESIHIDYVPEDRAFSRYSFAHVYQKSLEGDKAFLAERFEGKIVLIGAADSLNPDRHPTPLYGLYERENKRTHGIEIVANVVHTLISGRFYSEMPLYSGFAICLGLALLTGFVAFQPRKRYFLVFSPLLMLALGGVSLLCFLNHLILPLVPGLAVMLLCQPIFFGYRHIVLDREKRRIRSVFRRFLPAEVISQLTAAEDADFLRGENRRLCILFSDIRSFTKYSENRQPHEVVSRLNEYFGAMSHAVSSEDGIVDKFLGDGLMAFFGVFENTDNPSAAGARAALKMLEELERLNRKWQAGEQETFRIGIGLHTGEVKVGIGSPAKMEYTVIGDAVNLASRLQDKTKMLQETILMSETVYEELADQVVARDKGVEEIRGRSPIRVYALDSLRGSAS